MASQSGIKTAAGFVIYIKLPNTVKYLFLQTSYGMQHWTPPKGHVDAGETAMDTAFRETEEETGISRTDILVFEDTLQTLKYEANGAPKVVYYWLAELKNTKAKIKLSEEHQDFKWLDLVSAYPYAKHQDMKDLLNLYNNYIIELFTC